MNQRERAAFNRGLEMAARCAELYADENRRMAEDTLLADPILMGTTTRATFREDRRKSEGLILDGHKHCSAALAADAIALNIRSLKRKEDQVKLKGIRVTGVDIDKSGTKLKPKRRFRSVSAEIAARKKPKQRYKRGK